MAAARPRGVRPPLRLPRESGARDLGGHTRHAAAGGRSVTGDPVDAIARAVLYEGYVLWPYRRSANKNRQRWTFGGVHPAGWSREHPDDRCVLRTECLLEGPPDAAVDVGALPAGRAPPAGRRRGRSGRRARR